ncbi:tripartite tricarboxylate transporter substrate binding protein [Oleispirillum naphthae]|uniref:Bug family tripartite tricarboxylate transporter substrate binding protein n=1 Tax=Oleispirillum naphthae TaxID=2838853 RepID=UPI0030822769
MKRLASGLFAFALSAAALAAVAAAAAADYPARPVQIIVPYNAGGGTDLTARLIAQTLEKYLGGTVLVRNQPGGGGGIGTSAALHARPDGYTLGTGSQGPLAMLPHYGGIDYTIQDVDFLALIGRNLMVVAVNKNAPIKDGKAFLAYAEAHPGRLTVGNSGAGGANQIAMEGFAMAAGVQVKSLPFGGSIAAITACIGGHIQAVVAHPAELIDHVKAGNLRVVMVFEDERIPAFPDAETAKELGVDFTWAAWKGLIAPKGLPAAVRAKLVAALDKTFHDKAFLAKMTGMGEDVDYRRSAEFKRLAERDAVVAGNVIRAIGLYGMNGKTK